jgi:hypothetical protein
MSAIAQRSGDLDGAIALMRQCVDTYEAALQIDPRNFRVMTFLLGDYAKLGSMLRSHGKNAEAAAWFEKGTKLAGTADLSNREAADEVAKFKTITGQ